jgi:hypothetical protein
MVLSAIGDGSTTSKSHFRECLDNKSIMLKNTKKQMTAASSSAREKANVARITTMSRREMKKRGLLSNDPKTYNINEQDVRRTHHLWKQFVVTLLESCSNEAQVQNRLHEAGLLGAHVTSLGATSKEKKRKKTSGFVIQETQNCLFLAMLPEDDIKTEGKEKVEVKRMLKAAGTFAVRLPLTRNNQERVMVLHGKSFLPLTNGKSFGI